MHKSTFNCTKCGECCIYTTVKLSEEDMQRIEKLGHKEFHEWDHIIRAPVLKKNKDGCVFLRKKGDKFLCSIYGNRPEVCRKYPFFDTDVVEDCRPVSMEKMLKGK